MKIGNFECFEVIEGYFKLDGGAMFGSVPKTLWERVAPADDLNRIHMALRPLLVCIDDRRFLIDTGIGHKFNEKFTKMFGIDHSQTDIHRALQEHQLAVEDITDVILTHFHFDHAGGATYTDAEGDLHLTFPNARWHVHEDNVNLSKHPNPKDRASYLAENIQPVLESGKVTILSGATGEIFPGISYHTYYGHTTGLICPQLQSGGDSLVYCADVIPMAAHIPLPYIMGYDLYALTTMEEKEGLLNRALAENTVLFFEHDPRIAACHVKQDARGGFTAGQEVNMV